MPRRGGLTTHAISKMYRGRFVVRDVSLYVAAGEIVSLLGPNGAGKTTTFYILGGSSVLRADRCVWMILF